MTRTRNTFPLSIPQQKTYENGRRFPLCLSLSPSLSDALSPSDPLSSTESQSDSELSPSSLSPLPPLLTSTAGETATEESNEAHNKRVIEWASNNRHELRRLLVRNGAILFRNFFKSVYLLYLLSIFSLSLLYLLSLLSLLLSLNHSAD
jgi:hypothetical protein